MLEWIAGAAAALAAAWGGFRLFACWQGDADIRLVPGELSLQSGQRLLDGLRLRFVLPIRNYGRQKGFLLEILCRSEYLGDAAPDLELSARFALAGGRQDGYWEAVIVDPGQSRDLLVTLTLRGRRAGLEQLRSRPCLPLVFHHKFVGRSHMEWRLTEVRLPWPQHWQ